MVYTNKNNVSNIKKLIVIVKKSSIVTYPKRKMLKYISISAFFISIESIKSIRSKSPKNKKKGDKIYFLIFPSCSVKNIK